MVNKKNRIAQGSEQSQSLYNAQVTSEVEDTSGVQEQIPVPNKYKYDAFVGFAGERLLKSILRKILPLALYETWQVLVENQAQNNDAFLGITKLAEYRQRTDRKVRMDLDELEGRRLLIMRTGWKVLQLADGSVKTRAVTIKDFGPLYDLALEYLTWTQSEYYIEAAREYAELIRANDLLMKKLIRFDNYRRILCNKKPGPPPQVKKSHLWHQEYQMLKEVSQTDTKEQSEHAQSLEDDNKEPKLKLYLQEHLQEPLKKVSTERDITNNNNNKQKRYSYNSESHSEERVAGEDGYTKSTASNHVTPLEGKEVSFTPTNQTKSTTLPSFATEKDLAKQASKKEEVHVDPRVQAFVELALAASKNPQGKGSKNAGKKLAPAKPNPLINRFVREMSPILGDEHLEASVTRSLRAVEQRPLAQKDILACLIKAYVVARDTRNVHAQYRRPGGDLRMPLFCTMFERFARDCAEGKFHYDDTFLTQATAADERLRLFIIELRPEEQTLQTAAKAPEDLLAPLHEDEAISSEVQDEEAASDLPATTMEPHTPDPHYQGREQREYLNSDDPTKGWIRATAARHADRLHDYLGRGYFHCVVLPTRCPGRYGFVIYEQQDPTRRWVYLTTEDIEDCMKAQ